MSLNPSGRIELSLTPLVASCCHPLLRAFLNLFPYLEHPCSLTSLPLVDNLPNSEVLTSTQSALQKAALIRG